MLHADFAVIGLGAMGSSILYQLAQAGHSVIGIDRYDPPHETGSSHGETRLTRLSTGEGAEFVPLVAKSHDIWRDLEQQTGETLLVQCGGLIIKPEAPTGVVHGKADFVRQTISIAQDHQIPHTILNVDEMRYRYPVLTGFTGGETGYFEPSAGYCFPERIIAAQLTRARTKGARVLVNTRVSAFVQSANGVTLETSQGEISVDKVVVAAGPWSGPFLGGAYERALNVHRQLLHWYECDPNAVSALRDLPVMVWQHGPSDENTFYSFPVLPGETTLKAATEQYDDNGSQENLDRVVRPEEQVEFYDRHLRGRISGVSSSAQRSVACSYTVTPNAGFIIDTHLDHDRIHVVAACSGHGFKHSGGIGHHVARALQDPSQQNEAFAMAQYI